MFCKNCGAPVDDGAKFCKNCGGKITEFEEVKAEVPVTEEPKAEVKAETAATAETVFENPLKTKLNKLLSGQMFLTAAILLSASVLFGLFAGNVNVITILFVIFAWMAYAAAAKNNIQTSHIRNISGTFCAVKVLMWVFVGCLGLVGILTLVFGSTVGAGVADIINRYTDSSLNISLWAYGGTAVSVIIFVAILVAIAVVIVMNLGYMTIHKFFKSLYQSIDSETVSVEKAKSASGWFLALGIISGVGALSSLGNIVGFSAFISNGCLSAVYILLYVMIRKAFAESE